MHTEMFAIVKVTMAMTVSEIISLAVFLCLSLIIGNGSIVKICSSGVVYYLPASVCRIAEFHLVLCK